MEIKISALWVFGILLIALLVMRLSLRLSREWRVLKRNWTWKDELMDTLFYAVLLAVLVFGSFKLIELLPM